MSTKLKIQRSLLRGARAIFRATGVIKVRRFYKPIRKMGYRLIWKFAAPDQNKSLEVGGHSIFGIGRQRGASGGMGLLLDSYEQESTDLFKKLIRPGMAVVDIGAHIGYYTLLAAKSVGPSGKVFAFEPEEANYRWLVKNVEVNGYQNVTCVPKVVADKSGSVYLWLGGTSGTHSLYPASKNQTEGRLVEATSMDDFFEAQGWPEIGMMKIDAEGAEPLIFRGMQQLLQRQTNLKIILEFNRCLFGANHVNPLEFLQGLQSMGFSLHSITGKEPKALRSDDVLSLCSASAKESLNLNLLCSRG